jgi:hypothetical protein
LPRGGNKMTEKQYENLMYAIALNIATQMHGEFKPPQYSKKWETDELYVIRDYERSAKQTFEYLLADPMDRNLQELDVFDEKEKRKRKEIEEGVDALERVMGVTHENN